MLLIILMLALPLTCGHPPATLVVLVLWGIAGFGMMAPQQSLLAGLSSVQAPLLLSLNGSMLYLGTALGAVISGSLIGHLDLSQLSWVGVPFGLLALGTLAFEHTPPRP